MRTYKHIFFDLDQTLWDFEANAREAFLEIFKMFDLSTKIPDFEKFFEKFIFYNELLWEKYRKGSIAKNILRTERFRLVFEEFNIKNNDLATTVSDVYMDITPKKSILMDGTKEVLEFLKGRYILHILTNGFPEVQDVKILNSGIGNYFTKIITSYDAGFQKPDKRIFEYALKTNNAKKTESIMIGDDLKVDILGAKKFGIDQVYFNKNKKTHQEQITYEIDHLRELMNIFG